MNPVSILGLIINLYEQVAELSEQLTQVQRANEDLQARLLSQAPAQGAPPQGADAFAHAGAETHNIEASP